MMEEKYGIPFIRVSYFGIEDTSRALYDVAEFFKEREPSMIGRTRELVREEVARILPGSGSTRPSSQASVPRSTPGERSRPFR